MIQSVIKILSIGTLVAHIFLVALALFFIFQLHKNEKFKKYFIILQNQTMLFAFLVSLTAASGSLFFSEIARFEPCSLCWWQRIFLYPQVIILGIAFWKKDYGARFYVISLSLIGAVIAGYQYIITEFILTSPQSICSAAGPSCLTNYFTQFGYITSPLMSFTAFILIIFLAVIWKKDYGFALNN